MLSKRGPARSPEIMPAGDASVYLDLMGVACPLNWARAKTALEGLASGAVLELVTDDPRAATDVPRAAEAEGYWVLLVEESAGAVRIRIER